MRQLPVIGTFLSMPGVRQASLSLSYDETLIIDGTHAVEIGGPGDGSDMWSTTISSLETDRGSGSAIFVCTREKTERDNIPRTTNS